MRMEFLRMRPEMCAMISWPFSSFTRNMVFGRVSEIVPSNSMTSSFAMRPGLLREVGQGRPTRRVFCHVAGLGAKFPFIGLRGRGQQPDSTEAGRVGKEWGGKGK